MHSRLQLTGPFINFLAQIINYEKSTSSTQLAGVVRTRRLSDQIYDLLLEQIRNGDFPLETVSIEPTGIEGRIVDNGPFKYAMVAPRTISINGSVSF